MTPSYYFFMAFFLIYFCAILPSRRRHRRRIHQNNQKGAKIHMNALIQAFQGKRVEVAGDNLPLGSTVGTIVSVEDGWFMLEDEKGRRSVINATYVSTIREKPKKEK